MPRSMTGFGSGSAAEGGVKVKAEVRALNHRFLEINVRLPRPYLSLEERVRQMVGGMVSRGHLDIFITIDQEKTKKMQIKVDKELAMAYYDYLKEIAQYLDIPVDLGIRELIALPGVIEVGEEENNPEGVWPVVARALAQALEALVAGREREGRRLGADLEQRVRRLEQYVGQIAAEREAVLAAYRERLQARAQELLGSLPVSGERLLQEVVFLAERSDVTEELVRLRSHLSEMGAALRAEVPVGRKLDFLIQEAYREVTTLGAKAAGSAVGSLVVACKEELEKIREQAQNLE
ncbi:MAG: YicC family protein [Clostridia bacterium]|nr:YicC family protein [Clostridia bacterium]